MNFFHLSVPLIMSYSFCSSYEQAEQVFSIGASHRTKQFVYNKITS